jgi:hypothetical protein
VRHPQVLVYEHDGILAALLRPMWEERRWAVREPRQADACLRLLHEGGPSVLVLKVGRNLSAELGLLQRAHLALPDVPVVVVGPDAAGLMLDADAEGNAEVNWEVWTDPVLAGLAWDLGASFVLFPPLPRDLLCDVVVGLMEAAA